MHHQDICLQNKCINCSPQVCFPNNHPEAIQHTPVFNQCCRQRKAHDSKQYKITSNRGKKKTKQKKKPSSNFQSLVFVRTLQGYKNAHLQQSTNKHPTLQLFAPAIINSDTNFLQIYSYIFMYIPPVCTQPEHYLWQDQSFLVVTRDSHRKGACKKSTQFSIWRVTTGARESIFFVQDYQVRIEKPTSLHEPWHRFLSLCLLRCCAFL